MQAGKRSVTRKTEQEFCTAPLFQKMISGKYKVRILWSLKDGKLRFSEIRKGLLTGGVGTHEVAPRVLGRELNSLVETGMIVRKDYQVYPRKVEYQLSAHGRRFIPVISVIWKWAKRELTGV